MEKSTKKAQELTAETVENAVDEVFAAVEQEGPAVTVDELEGMNMEDLTAEEPGATKVFKITDDSLADWAVCKIADERAELARLKELADEQIARIMEKVAAAEKRCENNTSFMTSKLAEYFETVPHKETKTKHSYRPNHRHRHRRDRGGRGNCNKGRHFRCRDIGGNHEQTKRPHRATLRPTGSATTSWQRQRRQPNVEMPVRLWKSDDSKSSEPMERKHSFMWLLAERKSE